MKKHKLFITLLFALSSNLIFAQSSETVRKYIATYKDMAVAEEIRTGVPAAITLAQGIHETGAGTSDLVLASNNHFGIKCKGEWTGATVFHDDDAKGECFRKYDDPLDSYRDHSDFLKTRPFYASLFKLDPTDYKAWAFGLKKAGYATNPKYPQILIKLIEDYDLQDYTLIALGEKKPDENGTVWASNTNTVKSDTEETLSAITPLVEKTMVYPTGVFRINETSVVWVPAGTAYLKLASEYDVSLSRLFEFNDMKPVDIAVKDGLIFLQRKRKAGATEFHIVVEGEDLHDIAQIEGIRTENLLDFNFLKLGMQPQAGEKLYLQTKAPAMPKLATGNLQQASLESPAGETVRGSEENNFILHIVQPRETVYAIAKKYAVGVDEVMKWNDMQTIDLKTGQSLRINKKSTNATN
jgi:hypothetical protein